MNANVIKKIFYIVIIFALLVPIVSVLPISVNPDHFPVVWPKLLSGKWYAALFEQEVWLRVLKNSLLLAFVSSTISIMLALTPAWGLKYKSDKALSIIIPVLALPLMIPPIIMAVGLYKMYSVLNLVDTFWGLLGVHILFQLPFATAIIYSSSRNINDKINVVAATLGAGNLETWRKIIIPSLIPAISRAWMLGVFISIDETIIALYLSGSSFETLPKRIWSGLRYEMDPTVAAIAIVIFLSASLFYGLFVLVTRGITKYNKN